MGERAIYVETVIDADIERIWAATQDPAAHVRWDVRFSLIEPVGSVGTAGAAGAAGAAGSAGDAVAFAYSRRTPVRTIRGTGVSIGEVRSPDGSRTSALCFATDDPVSPIAEGRGYWRYTPTPDGRVRFVTGYDYRPGWGVLDVVVRPIIGWATAWSFDRLRIWLERGDEPERWPLWSVLWLWRRDRPRAGRCRRAPVSGRRRADHLAAAPSTLARLPAPPRTT